MCLERDKSIFPLLFNYFVASLLLVGTSLHSLLSPTDGKRGKSPSIK